MSRLFYHLRPLILASGSPRRRELLRSAGLKFKIIPAPSEAEPLPGEAPAVYARRAARGKAEAAMLLLGPEDRQAALLSADTIVTVNAGLQQC